MQCHTKGIGTKWIPKLLIHIHDNLTITFQSALEEADITVTDKDGNVVVSEFKTSIYEGKTVSVPNSDSYPYLVEITSPRLDIEAEITSEDY